ncbi:MAG: trypsin-like peptidase domain-containing protein [Paracoccaceae bacterium]
MIFDVMRWRGGRSGLMRLVFAGLAALILSAVAAVSARAEPGPLDLAMDTVLVVRSNDAEDRFLGSAFLWGAEAVVAVTNAHVVGDAEEVRLIDRHGHEEVGLVIARDLARDVAVISVAPGADGTPRRGLVATADTAGLGQEVYALGAPLGIEFTLTEGLISATARQVDIAVPLRMLQHDAAVNPGSSGGPLVDRQGRLVGMNSQIADGSRMFVGIAYAIAAPDLGRIVAGLIEETLAPVPVLGLQLRPVDRKVAAMLGLEPKGLLVDGVKGGGLAAAAGLRAGDVILSVDGAEILQPGDLAFLIEAAQPAGEARLGVLREGARRDLALAFQPADEEDAPALGIKLRDIDLKAQPERVASYRLAALGVMLDDAGRVDAITDNSPGLFAGLARGDRILAVNGKEIDPAGLEALEITAAVLLLVEAPGGGTRHIFLDPWGGKEGMRPVGGSNVLDPSVIVF